MVSASGDALGVGTHLGSTGTRARCAALTGETTHEEGVGRTNPLPRRASPGGRDAPAFDATQRLLTAKGTALAAAVHADPTCHALGVDQP